MFRQFKSLPGLFFLRILQFFFKERILKIKAGPAKGLSRRLGFGLKPKLALTKEDKFLIDLDFRGKTVFDIGAYIGILTLFFARAVGKSGQVVAFEPNPKNFKELKLNIALNGFKNVTLIPVGLGRESKQTELMMGPVYPSRSTFDEEKQGQILKARNAELMKVEIDSLDEQMRLKKLPKPDFVKIDVEGFEVEVLKGMLKIVTRYKPKLFIEIHRRMLGKESVDFLRSNRYSIYNVELAKTVTRSDVGVLEGGQHLFCE